MTSKAYILVELVHEFNANMKEAMMLKTMHCDTAADVYAWAATCIRTDLYIHQTGPTSK